MQNLFVICCLLFCHMVGVFRVDAVKSVSVMEGDSVTLRPDTELPKDEIMKWRFGPENSSIATINKETEQFTVHDDVPDGRFRDRLKLDHQTGSLTITNITATDAGIYEIRGKNIYRLNVTVFARLPVPVISRLHPQKHSSLFSSGSKCVLLCSVVNVSHVTLSWYKGNSLFSSVRVSGHSVSFSLPLECLNDSYSCVVAYSFVNRTTHLTAELCPVCPDSVPLIVLISSAAAGSLVIVAAVGIFCICRKRATFNHSVIIVEPAEVIYASPIFYNREAQQSDMEQEVEQEVVFTVVGVKS